MRKNSNTNSTNIKSETPTKSPHFPMILKLVSGEELIVTTLTPDNGTEGFIITNPYIVLRQVIQNIPHLYLSKWISYSGSDIFMLNKQTVMIIGIPNIEILTHYNVCLEEEIMNDFDNKINTSQISTTKH